MKEQSLAVDLHPKGNWLWNDIRRC